MENTPNLTVTLSLPPPINAQRTITAVGDVTGHVVGGGITLAAGYGDFFLSLDSNYTSAELGGAFDETIDVALFSVRTGWRGRVGKAMMNLWLGGMYWDAEREISGSIPDPGGSGNVVNFKVLQGPATPWNLNVGLNAEISKAFQIILDYGFNFEDLDMLTLVLAYRF